MNALAMIRNTSAVTTDLHAVTTDLHAVTSSPTDSCILLGWNTTIPWDNPRNLISTDTELAINRAKSAILIPLFYLVGAPANTVNMAVFFRQGLGERINLCLFALALVDVVHATFLFVYYAERIYTQFTHGQKYGEVMRYAVTNNAIGMYGFGYAPMLLSAIISTERCVCVLFPLRARRCVPTKVLACLIVTGVGLLAFTHFAITAHFYLACFHEERTGRTSWRVSVTDDYLQNKILIGLGGIFYGLCVGVGGPAIVLVTTVITTVKLQQTIRWRHHASSSMSSKEVGVTRMLICLSVEFCVLSIPVIALQVVPLFVPQMNAAGHYSNTYFTLISLAELSNYMSSSVNFFVYYFTGSRYRETLISLFACTRSFLGINRENRGS